MDGGTGVPTVDAAAAGQDAWDWEVLQPDAMSSSRMSHDDGTNLADDQETKQELIITPPSSDADADVHDETLPDECKDIGVVPDEVTKSSKEAQEEEEEEEALTEEAGDPPASTKDEEEDTKTLQLQSLHDDTDKKKPADAQADADDDEEEQKEEEEAEEDDIKKQDNGGGAAARTAGPECVVFSVGKLKVNGIGALCSFGVAAATVCIFLIGGRMQHRQQQSKIQLQFYGDDDKRIQQVVQQTSRLNQTMSSVMGGGSGGGSTRANISFGGYYDGL